MFTAKNASPNASPIVKGQQSSFACPPIGESITDLNELFGLKKENK